VQLKEAEAARTAPSSQSMQGNIRHGSVYERVPHTTLKSGANNAEIDVIWEEWQAKLEPLREAMNKAMGSNGKGWEGMGRDGKGWEEWGNNRELSSNLSVPYLPSVLFLHQQRWSARISRQQEIGESIAT
jgi:adenine-specific DNA-methyltransferase